MSELKDAKIFLEPMDPLKYAVSINHHIALPSCNNSPHHSITILCFPFLLLHTSPMNLFQRTHLSTVGDRAFPVAATHLWNGLPSHITAKKDVYSR